MSYTAAQTAAASSDLYVNILKYAAAVLAGLAGLAKAVQVAAGYLAKRKATVYGTRRLRISRFERPAPWQGFKGWPKQWTSESRRRKYWRHQIIWWVFVALISAFNVYWPISIALSGQHGVSTLIALYAVAAVYAAFLILCLKWIHDCAGRYKVWSPVRNEVTFAVKGSREDVVQYCYVVLTSMGATIVEYDEEQGTFLASVGLWVRHLFSGSQLSVSVSSDRRRTGCMLVTMSSDAIGPNSMYYVFRPPHARNVQRFVQHWNFSGIGQEEADS